LTYRHLFGPVPSRRLGTSLGIDLTPDKSCTLNCVYCECGKTGSLTLERAEYVPTQDVLAELRDYLSTHPRLDSITFSGSGEPTLHTGIGTIIRTLKQEFPDYTVTVLTNGTLLSLPEVRADLLPADRVIPSLDAISERTFMKINRPFHRLSSQQLIHGLLSFRAEYVHELWLEIFIIAGVNDTPEELELFRQTLPTLGADRIQLNTLDRPGAVEWIEPVPYQRLEEIAHFLDEHVEVIASRRFPTAFPTLNADARERILATIQVRPCTSEDLAQILSFSLNEVSKYLTALVGEERIDAKRGVRGIFYSMKSSEKSKV
jgi:wyosine [tRNA(Phe)-imidazoG37] synthetase (radical SAM superfamily)